MLSDSEITEIIRELYLGWTSALTVRDYSWFEKHLARDFMLSAQPFPEMRVNKEEFIEIDKKIGRADIRFVTVKAERAGDIVVSFAVADITEEFDQDLGTGLPTAGELNKLLDGKRLAYTSAWRKNGDVWQCFDHHMIGLVNTE